MFRCTKHLLFLTVLLRVRAFGLTAGTTGDGAISRTS